MPAAQVADAQVVDGRTRAGRSPDSALRERGAGAGARPSVLTVIRPALTAILLAVTTLQGWSNVWKIITDGFRLRTRAAGGCATVITINPGHRQRFGRPSATRKRYGRGLIASAVALGSALAVVFSQQAFAASPPSVKAAAHRVKHVRSPQAGARALAATGRAVTTDQAALEQAYASARHLPKNAIGGLRAGSLHLATVPATGAKWAVAGFTPSAAATANERVGFQDGASTGVFTQAPGQAWRLVQSAAEPYACSPALSAAIRTAWRLRQPAGGCGAQPATAKRAATRARAAAPAASSIGQSIASKALSQVGIADTPAVTSFSGVDCDPYSTLVGPPTPNSDGCGPDSTFSVVDTNEAWCSDFAKWIWQQAGVTADMNTLNAGADSFYAWGKAQGQTLTVDSSAPAVGDAVVFYPPGTISTAAFADHVGIVTAVNSGGTVNLVNGDFLGDTNISVQYSTDVDLSTWASQVWSTGEQWVFVAPPTATQPAVPQAAITGPRAAEAGTAVSFSAQASEAGGSITGYLWTFGNGATATGADATHVFTNAGPQTVTMSATSSLGTVTTQTQAVDVFDQSSAVATTPNTAVWYSTQLVDQSFFAVSSSGALGQDAWNGAAWLDTAIPGQADPGTGPAVVNYPDANGNLEPHVFFRSAAGTLAQSSRADNGTWTTQTLAGQPAPGATIVAATGADPGLVQAGPQVFYATASGQLGESYQQGSSWVTATLPGPAASGGSLALADAVVANTLTEQLFYVDTQGALTMLSSASGQWAATTAAPATSVGTGSPLAALTTGPDGNGLEVFYVGAQGGLADATSGAAGQSWASASLPGTPAAGSSLTAASYLSSSGALTQNVFYLTASGSPSVTSYNGSAWTATALPGTATAVLGSGNYPEPGQPQRLFLAGGGGLELDATSGSTWAASTLPDTPATFAGRIELYAADATDDQSALSAAQAAGLPASQVTESFATAWADTLSGAYLVIAVGGPADNALYYNDCGWANPSGEDPGTTPFYDVIGPADALPGTGGYEDGAGQTAASTRSLATDLTYYAVHGALPSGVTSLPAAAGPADACSGEPSSS
jgi:hypothetical protein